mmetsp:Transcript_42707/g.106473  ORF Transcript_42707/g.106473 Transcript_42707/m.106473 type:complete len:335 (+) Transcript_42707:653-1657(+)
MHRRVPVPPAVLIERAKDAMQDFLLLRHDQGDNVLIVPQEERALGHLEMRAVNAHRDAVEEGLHELLELLALHHLEDLLHLVEEEDFFGGVGPRPELEDDAEDLLGQVGVFLDELRDAVRELLVVHADVTHLVEGQQRLQQELLVLFLERQRKAVDDRTQDLEQLGDAVVALGGVDEPVEDVVDRLTDEGAVRHELAVDAVQDRLQVVTLARILRIEQIEELDEEGGVNVLLDHLRVRLVRHDKAQQELVDVLEMRPRDFQHGLVLLRVVLHMRRLVVGSEAAEEVRRDHVGDVRERCLVEDPLGLVDVVHDLEKVEPLELLVAVVSTNEVSDL